MSIEPATLTLTDAAKYLGVSKVTFYKDVEPTLPVIRGLTNFHRYRRVDLDAWIEERLIDPPTVRRHGSGSFKKEKV